MIMISTRTLITKLKTPMTIMTRFITLMTTQRSSLRMMMIIMEVMDMEGMDMEIMDMTITLTSTNLVRLVLCMLKIVNPVEIATNHLATQRMQVIATMTKSTTVLMTNSRKLRIRITITTNLMVDMTTSQITNLTMMITSQTISQITNPTMMSISQITNPTTMSTSQITNPTTMSTNQIISLTTKMIINLTMILTTMTTSLHMKNMMNMRFTIRNIEETERI